MGSVIIREAMHGEVESIADLWLKMCKELNPDAVPDKQAWVQIIQGLFKTGKYHIVVAEQEGQIIGFLDGFAYLEPSIGQMLGVSQHIYILPLERGGRIAHLLYEYIMQFANNYKIKTVQITCDHIGKKKWERKGFKVDKFIMSKEV